MTVSLLVVAYFILRHLYCCQLRIVILSTLRLPPFFFSYCRQILLSLAHVSPTKWSSVTNKFWGENYICVMCACVHVYACVCLCIFTHEMTLTVERFYLLFKRSAQYLFFRIIIHNTNLNPHGLIIIIYFNNLAPDTDLTDNNISI